MGVNRKKLLVLQAAMAVGALVPSMARADNFTWIAGANGSKNDDWTDTANWVNSSGANAVPGSTDNIFIGTAGNAITLENGARTVGAATFNRSADVTISSGGSSGSLTLGSGMTAAAPTNAVRTYTISVPIVLGGNNIWNVSSTTGITTLSVSGAISGVSKTLTKTGTGILVLSTSNSYSGATTISGGTLALGAGGSIATSPSISVGTGANFDVSAAGLTLAANQTLSGMGNVYGAVTGASTAKIAPDAGQNLTLKSNLTLASGNLTIANSGSSFAMLTVEGNVTLSNTLSTLTLTSNFHPTVGTSYMILEKKSAGAISGNFANLAQNALFTVNGDHYKISYTGGIDSNDIVLTAMAVPEPSSMGLLAIGASGLLRRRRTVFK